MGYQEVIYDCFMFFNENNAVEIRFEELFDVVDRFVVVWSRTTFRGNAKPDLFDVHRHIKWGRKIFLHEVEIPDAITDTWPRETHQRNGIAEALSILEPNLNDTIILSDADEIPRASVMEKLGGPGVVSLELDHYVGWLNAWSEYNQVPKAFPYSMLKAFTPQEIRKMPAADLITNAGWEFSSLGNAEEVAYKLKNFAHHEYDKDGVFDVDNVDLNLVEGWDLVGRGNRHVWKEIDDTWPEAVTRDLERWKEFVWLPTSA